METADSNAAAQNRLNGLVAISVALLASFMAVTALTNKRWLLYFSWCFAAFGTLLGLAGLCGLHIHPDWLTRLLS